MSDSTCWIVSCSNYGHSKIFCEHYGKPEPRGGSRGSEAGCYG